METEHESLSIETELSRDFGLVSALAIGVGTMIAAGIFTLSGLAVRNVGSAAVLSFILAGIVAMFTALSYCEFVSIYPESGEGYLYARKTFAPPAAYFVGWALLLGYMSSCAFYISSLSSYFQEFIWHLPIEGLSGALFLIGLVLLNIKGTKESAKFQIVVTAGKVVLLIWFVFGGLQHVNTGALIDRFSNDVGQIGSTAAMVFITFFGFSAIAASAGEVKDPGKTIPKAIFLSMAIVTVLYSLVIVVVVAANLTEYTEAAMGNAARHFLGPIGGIVIVAGAIFSMVSASNASIIAGSRVVLSMSRMGHFPEGFGTINPSTRTPIVAVMLVGGTILVFSILLELEDLAHFADTVLLLALILVNYCLIRHRRKFPHLKRPFRVPLVPLIPLMGIIANLCLLTQILRHPLPVVLALFSLALGMLAFFAWKGAQTEAVTLPGTPSYVALGRYTTDKSLYRVLVPIANPDNVRQLVHLASAIARERHGEVVALRVIRVPEQSPPTIEDADIARERQILEFAHDVGKEDDVPITSLVRVGHNTARAILETARERDCDLIVLGWKGFTTTREKLLGEITDAVVTNARCNIMLVKLVGADLPKTILLPTAGGEHAQLAEEYAASILRNRGGELTVCSVYAPNSPSEAVNEVKNMLDEAVERIDSGKGLQVSTRLISHVSVSDGIIQEADKFDLVMLGATGQSMYQHLFFGTIPEVIAKHSDRSVIVVKRYHPVKALMGRVMRE